MPPRKRPAAAPTGPSWRDVEPSPLILLTGKEDYLAARAVDRIRSMVKEANGGVEFTRVDAATYGAGQLSVLASPSLFDDAKVIVVEDLAQMNDDLLQDALAYVQQPDSDVVVVFAHSGGTRGKKLLDALKATAVVVECAPLKNDRDKVDFVRHEFRVHGRTIDPDAARALTEAVGTSTSELAAACAQLLSDGPDHVTYDDVDTYYGGRVEATAFKVADAALAGRSEIALKLWRQALDTGTDPVPMVAALASKVRLVAAVHGVRGSAHQLAGQVGAAPWQVERAQQETRRFEQADLVAALRALAEADAQVKGESKDAAYAVERAITTIALSGRHAI
ncbi:DNA polymerase III subunit delta [Kocuria sp. JC486]|uniref:DNA polymerase III subunit delta n=1 Tax=Kocuria soli TaxID=2485125 RepID=A0A3N3ZSZ5_9MICC|nr:MULTISPECIES: DNA polymerase III subunit delta [Kocuria]NHU84104.1 DNA polymerase III subunit delta [Kocuria sp. JC486]ROZ64744.1 DNA polymerase III subunit delta [Kocuria soli]